MITTLMTNERAGEGRILKDLGVNLTKEEKKKNNFGFSLPKKTILLSLILSLHLLGIIAAFFRTDIPFHYHLLRFFSWWSVHTSIFTVLAVIMIFRERKKVSSYFSQFITFLAAMY